MERGYVKLWRKSLDTPIFQNQDLFCFWCYCLMKASHKKYKVLVGLTMVDLEPGQFIFGRNKASLETGLSERKIRTCLKKLKNFGNVTSKATSKFSIISVINWDTYQQDKIQNDQQVTSKRPASDQQVTTNKNIKHIKNNKNKQPSFKKYLEKLTIENNFIESKDKIFEFFNYRQAMPTAKRYKSEKGIDFLFKDLNGCRDDGLIISECIDEAIGRGWQTPQKSYFKNNGFGNQNNYKSRTEQNRQACQEFVNEAGNEE